MAKLVSETKKKFGDFKKKEPTIILLIKNPPSLRKFSKKTIEKDFVKQNPAAEN